MLPKVDLDHPPVRLRINNYPLYTIKSGALSLSSSTTLSNLTESGNVALDEAGAYAYAIGHPPMSGVAISGYAIGSGSFVPLSGSPYTFFSSNVFYTPAWLQTAPASNFLYGTFLDSIGSGGAFGVIKKNADGTLGGFASGSPVPCAITSVILNFVVAAAEPTQTFVYYPCSGKIGSASIDPSTGAITATSVFVGGVRVAVDPSGKWLLTWINGSSTVDVLLIDPSTGALMEESNPQFPANGYVMAFDHTGRFLYVVNSGNNSTTAYSFDAGTGVLAPIQGATYATAQVPVAVTVAQP